MFTNAPSYMGFIVLGIVLAYAGEGLRQIIKKLRESQKRKLDVVEVSQDYREETDRAAAGKQREEIIQLLTSIAHQQQKLSTEPVVVTEELEILRACKDTLFRIAADAEVITRKVDVLYEMLGVDPKQRAAAEFEEDANNSRMFEDLVMTEMKQQNVTYSQATSAVKERLAHRSRR